MERGEGGYYSGRSNQSGSKRNPASSGCGCLVMVLLMMGFPLILGIIGIVGSDAFEDLAAEIFGTDFGYVDDVYDSEWDNDEAYIGESTWQREAIDKDLSEETAWYQDNNTGADCWIHDVATLEDGLQYFFEQTGVRPYLYINTQEKSAEVLDMDDEERFYCVEELYEELFSDGGHALLVISDDGNDNWRYDEHIGAQALLVMDYEAVSILYNYINFYHFYRTADLDKETLFANSFRDTADHLMGEETAVIPEDDTEPEIANDPEQEVTTTAWASQAGMQQNQKQTTTATTAQPNVFSQMKDGIEGIKDKAEQASVSDSARNYIALALVLIIGAAALAAALAWRKKQDERERNR